MRRRAVRSPPWQAPTRPQSFVLGPQVACVCRLDASRPQPRSNPPREGRVWLAPASRRRGTPVPASPAAAPAFRLPEPRDPSRTDAIRSRTGSISSAGSRSNGSDPKIPLRLGRFAKEPSGFRQINPQSTHVQKYLQIGPDFCTDPPEFSRIRTRRPAPILLHVRPQI